MAITYSEKQAITERIEKRINQVINRLEAEHANDVKDLKQTMRTRALEQLGMSAAYGELESKQVEVETLEERIKRLQAILGKAVKLDDSRYYSSWDEQFEKCLGNFWRAAYNEALAATDWGQRIAELQRERDALVDTVLVATSSRQLKDLWGRFDKLLGIEPTEMQRQVLEQGQPTE